MYKETIGNLDPRDRRFALVVGRFNDFITRRLEEAALDCFTRHGAAQENITIVRVPGSFEIPLTAAKLAQSGRYAAIICLGAIIRGATSHFDLVAAEAAKGVAQAGLASGIPVIFGILTTDTIEQAVERAGTKAGNRGWDAAMAAMEMADLYAQLETDGISG